MEYPKPVMKMSELKELGFPEEFLVTAYRTPGQRFASKMNPTKPNSTLVFETAAFDAWWRKQIAAEVKAMPRGGQRQCK